MSVAPSPKRFKANPVEVAIFSVVSLIFAHSVYKLLYDRQGFRPAALTPMASSPISEGRTIASVPQTLLNLDYNCDKTSVPPTTANKIRLNGPICGTESGEEKKLLKATVTNESNNYVATVFSDQTNGKFSTDYIPLVSGKNQIHVEFTFSGKERFAQQLQVTKN